MNEHALRCLPESLRPRLAPMFERLAGLPGIVALAIGGSRARGTARPDSDVDCSLYYRAASAPEHGALLEIAREFHDEADPQVTDYYGWGPWVNGGAWLNVQGQRVDWLFREVGQVERTFADLRAGRHELDWAQQPPMGFVSIGYGAELHVAQGVHDPEGWLAPLVAAAADYPEPLREAVVWQGLRIADFTLMHAASYAGRADVFNAALCLGRTAFALEQALFAVERVWFASDKTALEELEGFTCTPPGFAATVREVLARPGDDVASLGESVGRFVALFRATVERADGLYERAFV